MDSEKVRWFAETVMGATLHETKWGYKSYHVTGGGVHDLLALPRDLNAVCEPAAGWLRGLNLFLSIEDVGYGSWKATARGETKDVIARHDHPAEAIIELVWEVGHA